MAKCYGGDENDTEGASIDYEGPSGKALKHAHQTPNREECGDRGYDEPNEKNEPAIEREIGFVKLPNLFEAGQGDRGQTK